MLVVKFLPIVVSVTLVQTDFCSIPDYYYIMRYKTPYQQNLLRPRPMDLQTFASHVSGGDWVELMFLAPSILAPRLEERFTFRCADRGTVTLRYLLSKDFSLLNWELIIYRTPFARKSSEGCSVFKNLRRQFHTLKHGRQAVFRAFDGGRIRETRYFSQDPSKYLWKWFCMDFTTIRKGRCAAAEGFLSLQIRAEMINRLPWDIIMDDLRRQLHIFPDDKRFLWTYVTDPCAKTARIQNGLGCDIKQGSL